MKIHFCLGELLWPGIDLGNDSAPHGVEPGPDVPYAHVLQFKKNCDDYLSDIFYLLN